jgi:hypothetical protein
MNAVRSLGNLLRLLCAEQLRQPNIRELVFQAVTAITNCATSKTNSLMKVWFLPEHKIVFKLIFKFVFRFDGILAMPWPVCSVEWK